MSDSSGERGLVPAGLDYEAVAPFLYLALALLNRLGLEPAVQQYTSAEPNARHAIRALSVAAAAAGARVRDSGRVRDQFEEHLRLFTAEEIWLFGLLIDVTAMVGSLGGLAPGTHASAAGDLRLLDVQVHSHHWKAELRKAGDGPVAFREIVRSLDCGGSSAYKTANTPRSWIILRGAA